MKVHFLSDTHFFHTNIIKYCSRPFTDSDEMNAEMVKRWNTVVAPDDIVIHGGDLTAGLGLRRDELRDLIRSLNGTKVLVRGNHDHQTDEWYLESGMHRVYDSVNFGGVLLVHYPLHDALSRGFDESSWGVVEHVVHGHVHAVNAPEFENHYNVAADRHDFTPVPLEKVVPQSFREAFVASLTSGLATYQ